MSVTRRGKFYHYDFEYKCNRFQRSTKRTTRREALAVEAEKKKALIDAENGIIRSDDGSMLMTLNIAAERYFQDKKPGKSQESQDRILSQLDTLERVVGGKTYLHNITDKTVSCFVATRRGEKNKNAPRDHKKPCRCERCSLTSATVNREVQLLRGLMLRARNAWEVSIKKLRRWSEHFATEPEGRVRELSEDEEIALFKALRQDFHPLILFLLLSGVRKNNAVTLTWKQVDFENALIHLRVKSKLPGGRTHTIPMTHEIRAVLQSVRGNNPVHVFTYLCQHNRLMRKKGERYPFSKQGWDRAWRGTLKAAKIEDCTVHDLRHSCATRLLRSSGNLKIVQLLLGHKDIATTTRYAHVQIDDIREAMEGASQTKTPAKVPAISGAGKGKVN